MNPQAQTSVPIDEGESNHTVVLVPGLFCPPLLLRLLARRLKRHGFTVSIFRNRFFNRSTRQNAEQLLHSLQNRQNGPVHLLGYSLGGLVVLQLLALRKAQPVAQQLNIRRIVLLATPVNGSEVARRLYNKRWGRRILGKSAKGGLIDGVPVPDYGPEIGVLGGSRAFGLAACFFPLNGKNDGVVTESEIRVPAASDTDWVPQSHTLMLFSKACANKSAMFFREGRFSCDRQTNKTR